MATTVGSFSAIDDNEVDADSPVTETLVTRLRDNPYWLDTHMLTTELDTTLCLRPDGSGGTVFGKAGIDGTKGLVSSISTTWATLTTKTIGILMVNYVNSGSTSGITSGSVKVDLSDDTYVSSSQDGTHPVTGSSGTITTGTSVGVLYSASSAGRFLQFRRDSGNFQYKIDGAYTGSIRLDWVIL